jgi:hypothetical protein
MSAASFFDGYRQKPVSIRGVPGKSPMFFRDFSMMVFLADLSKTRAVLPGPAWKPLRPPLLRRALVAVHCMEYKDTDIGPYNEVSVSVALKGSRLPLVSLLQSAAGRYSAYIHSLPVSTQTAVHGGIDFFNYPKYLADIVFRDTGAHRICTLRDKETGELIMELEGRRPATWSPAARDENRMVLDTYPAIKGRRHRARMLINRLESASMLLRGANLRLGAHARSEDFKALGLGRVAEYQYAPRCQGVLFEPEPA